MMNRLLEFLFKLMLILVLIPVVLAMLFQSTFAVAKLFLPWVIVAIFVIGAVNGVVLASRIKHLLPQVSRSSPSSQAGAKTNFIRRPRGPRGKE